MTLYLRTAAVLALALASVAGAAETTEPADVSLAKEVDQYLAAADPAKKPDDSLNWIWKNGPRAVSSDGAFQVQLAGRLYVDWQWISSNDYDSATTGDGVFIRTARLAVAGHAYHNVIYKLQFDFAPGIVTIKDLFMGLRNIGSFKGTLILGHEKEPFGFEELTSSKNIGFMERSAPTQAFSPSRNTGASFGGVFAEKTIWAKIGVYKESDDQAKQMEDGKYNITLRVAWSKMLNDNSRIHVGGDYSYRTPNGGMERFRSRPGIGKVGRLVDTGNFAADRSSIFDVEFVFTYRSFDVSIEYFFSNTSRPGASSASFSGYYVQFSWFVTGERRGYSTKSFTFARTKPKRNFHDGSGGPGAWQILLRFDELNLSDAGIQGGKQRTYTLGINWYWNPNARIMFNFVYADIYQASVATMQAAGTLTAFTMRWQYDF